MVSRLADATVFCLLYKRAILSTWLDSPVHDCVEDDGQVHHKDSLAALRKAWMLASLAGTSLQPARLLLHHVALSTNAPPCPASS